jgi:hypothetical protein
MLGSVASGTPCTIITVLKWLIPYILPIKLPYCVAFFSWFWVLCHYFVYTALCLLQTHCFVWCRVLVYLYCFVLYEG